MKTIYNIKRLIEKQPKKLLIDDDYKNLINLIIQDSSFLKTVLKRKVYFDLDKCRININFLPIYLKKNSLNNFLFFINFYKLKLKYIQNKNKEKELIKRNIDQTLHNLDKRTICYLKLFYQYEKKISNNKPLITYKMFPKSINKAKEFIKKDSFFYFNFFQSLKTKLLKKYLTFDIGFMEFYISKYIFEFDINEKIDKSKIVNKYRTLSKKYHPDCGGNDNSFKVLNESRKILLDNFLKVTQN